MLLSLRKNRLTSLFKEVRVFKVGQNSFARAESVRNDHITTQLGSVQKRTQGEFLQFSFPSPHEAVVLPSAMVAKNMFSLFE